MTARLGIGAVEKPVPRWAGGSGRVSDRPPERRGVAWSSGCAESGAGHRLEPGPGARDRGGAGARGLPGVPVRARPGTAGRGGGRGARARGRGRRGRRRRDDRARHPGGGRGHHRRLRPARHPGQQRRRLGGHLVPGHPRRGLAEGPRPEPAAGRAGEPAGGAPHAGRRGRGHREHRLDLRARVGRGLRAAADLHRGQGRGDRHVQGPRDGARAPRHPRERGGAGSILFPGGGWERRQREDRTGSPRSSGPTCRSAASAGPTRSRAWSRSSPPTRRASSSARA